MIREIYLGEREFVLKYVIRGLRHSDIDGICRLVNWEVGSFVSRTDLAERLKTIDSDENYRIYVAGCGERVLGFVVLQKGITLEYPGRVVRVVSMSVDVGCQNKGIGADFLELAEKFAGEKGAGVVALNCGFARYGANAFYEKRGYTKLGYNFYKRV